MNYGYIIKCSLASFLLISACVMKLIKIHIDKKEDESMINKLTNEESK